MPTTPARARKWIESRKATPFWKRGVFCVRLNVEPSANETQNICVGIDPGSKREGFTVKAKAHTYLNVLTETPTWVGKHVEQRRNARKARRYWRGPCRAPRANRSRGGLPPSTHARWQWKLRVVQWLKKMYPVKSFAVEDVRAKTKKNMRKWNHAFSPVSAGKNWFYEHLQALGALHTYPGLKTFELRGELGLKKKNSKYDTDFFSHNVDSWVLAWHTIGGARAPDNTSLIKIIPLQPHRRQLVHFNQARGGKCVPYGGTRSCGLTRGSLVKHPKYGVCHVGGEPRPGRVSVLDPKTLKRVSVYANPKDLKFLSYASFRRAV